MFKAVYIWNILLKMFLIQQIIEIYIYIKLGVSLFFRPIITQLSRWTDLTHIVIGELGRHTGMFLAWF